MNKLHVNSRHLRSTGGYQASYIFTHLYVVKACYQQDLSFAAYSLLSILRYILQAVAVIPPCLHGAMIQVHTHLPVGRIISAILQLLCSQNRHAMQLCKRSDDALDKASEHLQPQLLPNPDHDRSKSIRSNL